MLVAGVRTLGGKVETLEVDEPRPLAADEVLIDVRSAGIGIKIAPTQVERWREVLVNLANDFHRGDVRVRPKNYPKTCAHCGQRILCRLDPADLEDDSEENEVEAEHG